jgi:hypothetical protein
MTPTAPLGRALAVLESGLGFGFLAMIIGYHPVLTQSFSRREIVISLLDARAGSPPSASEMLQRCGPNSFEHLNAEFRVWEVWAAELLENCLSFPMLAYYRSQHDNQSWLAALTVMLDTCAVIICGSERPRQLQSRLTFAIARHAAVDMMLIFKIKPVELETDRLDSSGFEELKSLFTAAGITVFDPQNAELRLRELRKMYEPFVNALSQYFLLPLPEFVRHDVKADNWQTSAWRQPTPGILNLPHREIISNELQSSNFRAHEYSALFSSQRVDFGNNLHRQPAALQVHFVRSVIEFVPVTPRRKEYAASACPLLQYVWSCRNDGQRGR